MSYKALKSFCFLKFTNQKTSENLNIFSYVNMGMTFVPVIFLF